MKRYGRWQLCWTKRRRHRACFNIVDGPHVQRGRGRVVALLSWSCPGVEEPLTGIAEPVDNDDDGYFFVRTCFCQFRSYWPPPPAGSPHAAPAWLVALPPRSPPPSQWSGNFLKSKDRVLVHVHFFLTSGDQAWTSRLHKQIAASSKRNLFYYWDFFVERISAKPNAHVGVKNHTEPKLLKRKRKNLGFGSLHPSILILVTWMQASFPVQFRTFKRHGFSVASPSWVTLNPTCSTALCHQYIQTNWAISTICLHENEIVRARTLLSQRLSSVQVFPRWTFKELGTPK